MRIIFDTDPGIDDAAAITVALHDPNIEIALMTTVAGNVSLDKTTHNARCLLDFYGKSIPLAAGASHPLIQDPYIADDIHGANGLADYEFPEPQHPVLPVHAVEAMRQVLMDSEEPVTLVPVGPLTNIALLLRMYPECMEKIDRIVLMGGTTERGNVTPYTEFNIYVDPEAAQVVFSCGLPVVMCGLNMTSQAILTADDIESLASIGRSGDMLASLFRFYLAACGGEEIAGAKMHDLTAVAYVSHPEFFTTQPCTVDVELGYGPARGATSVDFKNPGNVQACVDVDNDALKCWFKNSLKKIG